ncbi:LLM class flavin-dependent oxidoreductase [Mycolicibacterium sp. Y3]
MTEQLKFHWYLPTHGDTTTIADNRGDAASRVRSHLQPTLENLTALGRAAEDFGFEAVLTPTGSHCEDSWLATAALAQYTRRLKYLVAFRPGVLSPTLAAQQVGTYQRFTGNRLALNIVTGGDDLEMRRYGDTVDKLARYRRTGEFLSVVRGMWADPEFSFVGEFYRIESARSAYPLDVVPTIYFGGSSPEAIEVAAEHADVYLTWGEPPEQVAEKIERVRAAAARRGRTLRFGVRLHTVARSTEELAWQRADELMAGVTAEQVRSAHERYLASASEGQRRMAALTTGELVAARSLEVHPGLWAGPSLLRDGAGTAAIGSYEQVADVFREYTALGVTEFVLSGYPQIVEIDHVGQNVLPRLGVRVPV